VKIVNGTAASSDGEVFNGLGKDEVLKYADDPFWKRLRWILFILFCIGWLAMLLTAVLIIALAPRCPPRPDLKWYQTESVYQVIPESYKDSNDDGIGDFKGLKDKFEHIEDDLGMKAVWISNLFKTDGATYPEELGIIDHKAIRESFKATVDDLKSWMKTLRKEGKKVILDLVVNQVSKDHEWFKLSREGDEKYKDYFIWKASNASLPNNWVNSDETSAWHFDDKRQAHYFSQFKDYPDLNLDNDDVVEEIKDIMRFWFKNGVSGFHIKDVEYLVENPNLADDDADKKQTQNYPGTLKFLEKLREVSNEYSDKPGRERFLFATVRYADKNQTMSYWGDEEKDRLHVVIPIMGKIRKGLTSQDVKIKVMKTITDDRDQWLGLSLGDQYSERIATRLEDPMKLYYAHALELLLPGTAFNYYGDEFGQESPKIRTKDNKRTPMQWDNSPNGGFTSENVVPWIKMGDGYITNNLKAGSAHFSGETPLKGFIDLLKLRKNPSFQWGKTKMCNPNDRLFMFTRKATRFPFFLTMMNLSDERLTISLKDLECLQTKKEGTVRFHSSDPDEVGSVLDFHDKSVSLKENDVLVIEFAADDE